MKTGIVGEQTDETVRAGNLPAHSAGQNHDFSFKSATKLKLQNGLRIKCKIHDLTEKTLFN